MVVHGYFVKMTVQRLQREGYTILDKEVNTGLQIKGIPVRVDLLIEKNGKIIPVECGYIRKPVQTRILKLKEKYGFFKHIPYGRSPWKIIEKVTGIKIIK